MSDLKAGDIVICTKTIESGPSMSIKGNLYKIYKIWVQPYQNDNEIYINIGTAYGCSVNRFRLATEEELKTLTDLEKEFL